AGGNVAVLVCQSDDVAVAVIHVPERLSLERDGQWTVIGVIRVRLGRFAILLGPNDDFCRDRPRVALVMVLSRLLRVAIMIEVCLADPAAEHIILVALSEPIREGHLRQLAANVPFVLAASVRQQVTGIVVIVVIILISDRVLPMDKLIARV